jgi:hypothetical protein
MSIRLILHSTGEKMDSLGSSLETWRGEADLSGAGQTPSLNQKNSPNRHLRVSSKSLFGDSVFSHSEIECLPPHIIHNKNVPLLMKN